MTDPEALAERVAAGDLSLHELDAEVDPETAAAVRRSYLEREREVALAATSSHAFDAGDVDANVENLVGGTQLPLGVAGPLAVDGEAADGEYHLPLATTEGALVASVNRGCAAITAAGGATARVTKSGMTRAPTSRRGSRTTSTGSGRPRRRPRATGSSGR